MPHRRRARRLIARAQQPPLRKTVSSVARSWPPQTNLVWLILQQNLLRCHRNRSERTEHLLFLPQIPKELRIITIKDARLLQNPWMDRQGTYGPAAGFEGEMAALQGGYP